MTHAEQILREIGELRRDVAAVREDVAGLRGAMGTLPATVAALQAEQAEQAVVQGELGGSVRRLSWAARAVVGAVIVAVVTLLIRGSYAGV